MSDQQEDFLKGRGAQLNTANRFLKNQYVTEHPEGLDEPLISNEATQIFYESPKKIVNKIDSPDLSMMHSVNPYQGCEHGCIYCYARNSHQYWGFSAGLDFERKIIVKQNAAELLEKNFLNPRWKPEVISISGNTDCYQPLERKLRITRSLLEVSLKYKNPIGIITKNALVLRDIDILQEMSRENLVHVMVSITSLEEELRLKLEPRTATAKNRLKVIHELNKAGVPAGVMVAPVIPGLNSSEIPEILRAAGENGADAAGYNIVRLNGSIGEIFTDWIYKAFPEKADKVLNQIKECHGGTLNESRWGVRMSGEGKIAESIHQLFKMARNKYIRPSSFEYNFNAFCRPPRGQLDLFA